MTNRASAEPHASQSLQPDQQVHSAAPKSSPHTVPAGDTRLIECTECRSGLLHLTPKTGIRRILAVLLFQQRNVWRCHACGRTLPAS